MHADGIPFGITLLAPAGRDALLASIGRVFHADTSCRSAPTGLAQPPLAPLPASTSGDIAIAVVGAHLSGMALNGELKSLGGRAPRSRHRPRRTTSSMHCRPHRQNPACCASSPARDLRSSSKSGRCRRPRSDGSSPRSRRRSRSARSFLPAAAASRASSWKPRASGAHGIFRRSAAGGRTWRRRRRFELRLLGATQAQEASHPLLEL